MNVLQINKNNFAEVLNSEKPVLLDFYATWCGPCKMLSPILDRLAAEHDEFVVAKVNVDEAASLASEFGVASIPTLVVFKNGREVARNVGVLPEKRILELVNA